MDKMKLTDRELLGQLFSQIGLLAALGADAVAASEVSDLVREGIGAWLRDTATRFTLTAAAGGVLGQVALTEEWHEAIARALEG